ncbi:hypothetical protein H2198_007930 [Neophaeococcomyces mojaviensis]|uniref:Uncharacterized protein n=1 Tax=Neophaeococcomyces mojaviensis TaxID=3383035 RepID=A0ACC2ZZ18_9EURO|nr:hypothetical protein H2198_007930 [Knufia sp. JES_112]
MPYNYKSELSTALSLSNKFPKSRMRALATASGDTIFLRNEVFLDDEDPIFIDSTISAKALTSLLILSACSHGVEGEMTDLKTLQSMDYIGEIHGGFHFDDDRKCRFSVDDRLRMSSIFVQHTKDNELLQWLALQWQPKREPGHCLRVLQRKCCLTCILQQLKPIMHCLKNSNAEVIWDRYPICIILGNAPSKVPSKYPSYNRSTTSLATRIPPGLNPSLNTNNDQHLRPYAPTQEPRRERSRSEGSKPPNATQQPLQTNPPRAINSGIKRKPLPVSDSVTPEAREFDLEVKISGD